jgi:hypothetical protein
VRSPTAVVAASALVVLVVALAFGLTRPGVSRPMTAATPRQSPAPVVPTVGPAPQAADPRRLRDVFHFADERVARREPQSSVDPAPLESVAVPTPPPGPHLVGVLRRSGVLLAVLSLDGQVELAGPGQCAVGVTVLSIGDDSVRIRRPDGSEDTLVLPD